MANKDTYHFFYYKPRYYEKLFEINHEAAYVIRQDEMREANFDKDKFEQDERKFLKQNASNKYYRFYIAATGDELVGFIWFGQADANRSEGFIGELYVRPKHRRHGIATQLVQAAIEWLKDKDCTRVDLQVDVDNQQAMQFYKKVGFFKQKPTYFTFAMDLNLSGNTGD